MDEVKEAFERVKKDIGSLKSEIDSINFEFREMRKRLIEMCEIMNELSQKYSSLDQIKSDFSKEAPSNYNINEIDSISISNKYEEKSFEEKLSEIPSLDTTKATSLDKQTDPPSNRQINPPSQTPFSTNNQTIKPRKDQIQGISIGNGGVQTDRQTDKKAENAFDSAINTLNSLDNLKKEIRLKFKKLTDQELLVFSTIYQQEEELGYSNYKVLSDKLNLTESSIRDYVRRLIAKDIPLEKIKINNKEIHLSISPNFKKITSLNTILQLIGL